MTVGNVAIVLGVDSPIGLTLVRELGAHGIRVHGIGKTARAIGGASRHCARLHVRPPGVIADWLPPLIVQTGAAALLAVSESDLIALAALPAEMDGCRILTPRAEPLALVLDKRATLARAAAHGIAVPKSWQPDGTDVPALTFPAVLKWADPPAVLPALAAAGIDFIKAEYAFDAAELRAKLARYDSIRTWPLVQSYAPGHGLGQMFHMADGRATLRFQHRRLHEWPPEGGVSTLCEAVPLTEHRALQAQSEALLADIGWEGPAMVEYRHDPATGQSILMEINGRFWGSLPLASHAGAQFGWEAYRRGVLDDAAPAPGPAGSVAARYMLPETRRLARVLWGRDRIGDPAFRAAPISDLADYLTRGFRPGQRHYVWSWRDQGPFWRDMANGVAKLIKR